MHNDPKLFKPVLGLIVAALFVALAWKTDLPAWVRFVFVMTAIIVGTASVLALVDWLVFEATVRIQKYRYAQVIDVVSLANSVKGLTAAQTEFVKSRSILEITAISGDSGLFWRVRFPGGDVELEMIGEFLRASLECPGGYLWPVRDHTSAHWTAWKDYIDVEEKLRIITDGLVYFGFAEKASGKYAAKVAEGKTLEDLADYFRVEL